MQIFGNKVYLIELLVFLVFCHKRIVVERKNYHMTHGKTKNNSLVDLWHIKYENLTKFLALNLEWRYMSHLNHFWPRMPLLKGVIQIFLMILATID
jgi:hypothetical protein